MLTIPRLCLQARYIDIVFRFIDYREREQHRFDPGFNGNKLNQFLVRGDCCRGDSWVHVDTNSCLFWKRPDRLEPNFVDALHSSYHRVGSIGRKRGC